MATNKNQRSGKPKTPTGNAKRPPQGRPQNARPPQNGYGDVRSVNQKTRQPNQSRNQNARPNQKQNVNNSRQNQLNNRRPAQNSPPKKQKPKLTPEQIAERKRLKEEAERRARAEFKRMVDVAVARIQLFLVFFVAITIFSLCGILLGFFTGNSPDKNPFTYSIVQSISTTTDPITENISPNRIYRDGYFYVNFSQVADLYGLITTGADGEYRFLTDVDATQSVKFVPGTGLFEINGVPGRFAAPTFILDDDIYIPAELINRCMTGISVTYDLAARTVNLVRENESKLDTFVPIAFTLKTDAPTPSIGENTLDKETLYLTQPHYQSSVTDNLVVDPSVTGAAIN